MKLAGMGWLQVIKTVQNILRSNVAVATSLGTRYITQLQLIFEDMLNVYMMYSELVSMLIKQVQMNLCS